MVEVAEPVGDERDDDRPGQRLLDSAFTGAVGLSDTLRLVREGVISDGDTETFYELYGLAFDHLKTLAFGRQVLTREEFASQMKNERVWKYVIRNVDDEPVGLTTITRDLRTVPWISPDYFAANYPEQWSRDAVYYLGFTLAHPRLRHQRIIESLLRVGTGELERRRAVLAFDVCAYDERVLRLGERVQALLRLRPAASYETVDTQNYSRIVFG